MAILHLVRSSAFDKNDFEQCISLLQNEDAIVLLDDGCYNVHHNLISKAQQKVTENIFVIEHHYRARGIILSQNSPRPIDMNKLVQLTLSYDKSLTWQ